MNRLVFVLITFFCFSAFGQSVGEIKSLKLPENIQIKSIEKVDGQIQFYGASPTYVQIGKLMDTLRKKYPLMKVNFELAKRKNSLFKKKQYQIVFKINLVKK
jgi:hypothetical protein